MKVRDSKVIKGTVYDLLFAQWNNVHSQVAVERG